MLPKSFLTSEQCSYSQNHAMSLLPFIKVILAFSQPFLNFLSVFCPCLFHASFLTFIWHSFTLLLSSEPSTVHHTESIYMSSPFSNPEPATMFSVVSLCFHLFLGCSSRFFFFLPQNQFHSFPFPSLFCD